MKGKLPVSKAKTAYGLLSEIATLIVDEPLRYDQGRFLSVRQDEHDYLFTQFPACGTIGCVAGWAVALRGPSGADTPYRHVEAIASDVLGLTIPQQDELFDGGALASSTRRSPLSQTAAHAKAGARHIRRFQKKYRTQLLAKKV